MNPMNPLDYPEGYVTPDAEGVMTHGFMRTAPTGQPIIPYEPEQMLREDKIKIEDIGFSLSNSTRYNGHAGAYYTAQHCCVMHDWAAKRDRAQTLLHDAPEVYMGDLVSPLKRWPALRDIWKPLEHRWEKVIRRRFDVWPYYTHGGDKQAITKGIIIIDQEKRVKALDILILGLEMVSFMPYGEQDSASLGYLDERRPHGMMKLQRWSAERCEAEFLERWANLQD